MPASGVLRYPYEAITDKTDYLQVTIIKHPRSGADGVGFGVTIFGNNTTAFSVGNTLASDLRKKQLVENGVILLPMPSNIEDTNSVSYDGDSLNSLAAAGVEAVGKVVGTNYNAGGGGIGKFIKDIGSTALTAGYDVVGKLGSENLRGLALKAITAEAVNIFGANVSVNQILARSSGKILNPNMELLFNNVTLRTFRFSFKMVARDDKESVQIKAIIRTLKKNMAAKNVTNLFLDTPNIFELQYKKGNLAHPFLHKFKQCALSDISVNYTGDNVYATYNDGTPISIILNLTFKELAPIYNDDYPDETLEYSPTEERGGVGY